jgi:hypothetical protein
VKQQQQPPRRKQKRRSQLPNTNDPTYENPFRDANTNPARVDQGDDFTGTGPVYAMGPGRVVIADASGSGWPGGGFVEYKLTQGPAAGHYVYIAEDINPSVRVGQKVTPNTVVGNMYQGGSGIETGWAAGPKYGTQTLAWISGQANYTPGGDPGEHPTAYGEAYNEALASLGGPQSILSGKPQGTAPAWASLDSSGGATAPSAATTSVGSDIGSWIFSQLFGSSEANVQSDLSDWLERGALIVFGAILIIIGLFKLNALSQKSDNDSSPSRTVSLNEQGSDAAESEAPETAEEGAEIAA